MTRLVHSRIVNALTFARVPLIAAWAALAVWHELARPPDGAGCSATAAAACAAMLFSGLTDLWDGALARRWGVVTTLGKMADPLMDKIFYIVAFPVILWLSLRQDPRGVHGMVLLAFTVLYVLRDTWVTFLRMVGAMYGADVAAAWLGKVRTALSFPGAGWVYMYLAFGRAAPESWRGPWLASCYAFEALLIVLTVWSLVSYTAAYMPYMKKALERK